ncbi:DeoR/GlpR family DNA-binding transcription regulator [Nesterenkonia muleiensis]|uniref:DeoR/GlpR family DNA-binding transcription regulator n=1 Tax=Nesterenkonia muleiensis TaxID=2282648 RepID=UPI001EE4A4E2|nr:DeoR/GlpR family DNA-binding transcription regulator [Nesterenkonia muleiensis]
MPLLALERRSRILELLSQTSTVTVERLAAEFGVTRETVRRDLDSLETQGALHRVHGGATAAGAAPRTETPLHDRHSTHSAQKRRIAQAALQFLPPSPGGSMIIDAGSTTEAFADMVALETAAGAAERSRHLLTNALPVAAKLSDVEALDMEVIGGRVRGITGAAVGPTTVETLSRRSADVAFIGTNGVDGPFGLSTPDSAEAAVKTALIRAARRTILLADASKFERTSLVQFARLEEIAILITDAAPPVRLAEALDAAEVSVIVAEAP